MAGPVLEALGPCKSCLGGLRAALLAARWRPGQQPWRPPRGLGGLGGLGGLAGGLGGLWRPLAAWVAWRPRLAALAALAACWRPHWRPWRPLAAPAGSGGLGGLAGGPGGLLAARRPCPPPHCQAPRRPGTENGTFVCVVLCLFSCQSPSLGGLGAGLAKYLRIPSRRNHLPLE